MRHGRGVSIIDGRPVGVGTLDYAAPEQLLKGEFSVQSDVFALGKILRSLYSGRIPRNMRNVVRKATRERPGDRFASANEFASAIRHRNMGRWVMAACVAAACLAAALYPVLRPQLVDLADRFVRNQRARTGFALKGANEQDAAYFRRILPIAERGNVEAQVGVAEAYFYGRGVATNRVEAVRWYRRAAMAGDASAQASLGLCAFRGWGGLNNYEEKYY